MTTVWRKWYEQFARKGFKLASGMGQRKKSLKLEIGDTFWTGVSGVTHSFGNNGQGWKIST